MEAANKTEQPQPKVDQPLSENQVSQKRKESENGAQAAQDSSEERSEPPAKKNKKVKQAIEPSEDVQDNEVEETSSATVVEKFKWIKAIRTLLRQAEDQQLSVRKLSKQLRATYEAKTSAAISKEEINDKVGNILANLNSDKYEVTEKKVKLLAIQ